MKVAYKFATSVLMLIGVLQSDGQVPLNLGIQHESKDSTNRVKLSWEAASGAYYEVWTAMDFHHKWGLKARLWATNTGTSPLLLECGDTNYQSRRFYQVIEVPVPEWQTNSLPLLIDASERFELSYIPSGSFTMGSPPTEVGRQADEGPQTEVEISNSFWMSQYEVTQQQYFEIMGVNPSYHSGDQLPVEQVSWHDATNYCGRLTEQERNAERLPVGWVYRLPTEAEWEYACRAGTTTVFHFGSELRSGMANFDGTCEYSSVVPVATNPNGVFWNHPVPVGNYAPNAWGLFDMHGNVAEFCYDWYFESLPGGMVADPLGPPAGDRRVIRGDMYAGCGIHCRTANRLRINPNEESRQLGFRIVLASALP